MSVLGLTGMVTPVTPRPAASVPTIATVSRIDWTSASDGVWSGRLGLEHAGSVERTAEGFVAIDWHGTREGVFVSLDEAQRALEPEVRAARREKEERRRERRVELVIASALAVVCVSALSTGTWLLTLPL